MEKKKSWARARIEYLRLLDYGEPKKVVQLATKTVSNPQIDEVLVSMEAAPIHLSDILLIKGRYGIKPPFPVALGAEGVGRVVAVGKGVDATWNGKRVLVLPTYNYGTWASLVTVPVHCIVPVNEQAPAVQLAQASINAVTAYLLLRDYRRLMPGNWIAQTAANSAVGQYVIALAKTAGFRTLNIVRSKESAKAVLDRGGDAVVLAGDGLKEQIAEALKGERVSLVLDTVGGTTVGTIAAFLENTSPIVGYSSESGEVPVIAPFDLFYRRLAYHGFWVIDWFRTTPKSEIDRVLTWIGDQIAENKLGASVGGTYVLNEYQQALDAATQKGRNGKYFFYFLAK